MMAGKDTQEYRKSFKASSMVGGSSLFNVVIGLLRSKVIAYCIGAEGVGLLAIYTEISGLVTTFCSFGTDSSAVREIAVANEDKDNMRLASCVTVVRRLSFCIALLSVLALIVGSPFFSKSSWGDYQHIIPVCCLSVVTFSTAIRNSRNVVLQGTRKIKSFAKMNVWGSIFSTLIALPCYYIWGIKAVLPSFIIVSIANCFVSIYYENKLKIRNVNVSKQFFYNTSSDLLKLGLSFMLSAIFFQIGNYYSASMINSTLGTQQLGFYQSAFHLTSISLGFIFAAMGTDFYPKLTALKNDFAAMEKAVNQQSEMCFLLSMPVLCGLVCFAPLIIPLLYSKEFLPAIILLQINAISSFLEMISFPIGYVMFALGKGNFIIFKSIAAQSLRLISVWLFLKMFGLIGASAAYLVSYVLICVINLIAAKKYADVSWHFSNVFKYMVGAFVLLLLLFVNIVFGEMWGIYLINFFIWLLVTAICGKVLMSRLSLGFSDIICFFSPACKGLSHRP